jgi:hypothetical protein
MGAAWANTTTQVLGVAAGTIFTLVTFKVKLPLAPLLKSLLAALLMGGVIWLAGWLAIGDLAYILLALPLGVVVYTVLVLGLRVLDATDILMLRSVEEGLSGRLAVWAGRGVTFLERFAQT